MADTSNFRTGFTMRHRQGLWTIVEFQHVKPGKGPAFVRTKLKNIQNGKVVEETFRAGEKVEEVRLEKRSYQYLYPDGEYYVFMNMETYEQIQLHQDSLDDVIPYIKESDVCSVLLLEDKPLTVEPLSRSNCRSPRPTPVSGAIPPRAGPSPLPWKPAWWFRCPCSSKKGKFSR